MKKVLAFIFLLLWIIFPFSARGESGFSFRFALINDIHLDCSAKDNPENFKLLGFSRDLLETALAEISNINNDDDPSNDLDFILFGGDNINGNWKNKDYKILSEILQEIQIPFYMVPGDWDYATNYSPRIINEYYHVPHDNLSENVMFEDAGLPDLRKYDYSLDINKADGSCLHLIGMDNVHHFDGNRGSYEVQQLEWLQNDLACNNGKPTVILQHCPVVIPFSQDENQSIEDVEWIPLTTELSKSGSLGVNKFIRDLPVKKERAADRSGEFLGIVERYRIPLVLMADFHLNRKITVPEENPTTLLAVNPALISYPCAYTIYEITDDMISWKVCQIQKYAEKSAEYNRRSLEKYNQIYISLRAEDLVYNIEKTMRMSWGRDKGDNNDWSGYFGIE
jgi:hypothetical protein